MKTPPTIVRIPTQSIAQTDSFRPSSPRVGLLRPALTALGLLLAPTLHAAEGALSFSAASQQYVTVPDFHTLGVTDKVTVEFRARFTTTMAGQTTFGLDPENPANRFLAHLNYLDGNIYWDFGDIFNGGRVSVPNPAGPTAGWTHYALVASQTGNFMKIYINGTEVASVASFDAFDNTFASALRIGGGGGDYFTGSLDEFRVWSRARTPEQIAASRNSTLVGNEPGLRLYFKFDEASGNTAINSATATGAAYHGTLVNGPTRIGIHTVTSTADSGPGTLRQAVLDAAPTDDTIFFDSAVFATPQTITLTSGEIVLNKSLTIDGAACSSQVTISGGNSSRIFTVDNVHAVDLKGLTLTGGNGTDGGAIFNKGSLTLAQCTFSGNSAGDFGGAIFNLDGSTLVLTQCTLSGNSAPFEGGAIVNWVGTLTLINSIVAGSLAPSPEDLLNGRLGATIIIEGANLVQSLTNNSVVAGTGTISTAAPLLSPLGNYGGRTQTMLPLPGSPAIDGVPAGSEVAGLTTDQRGAGFARTLDGDGNGSALADIGAVELRGFIIVTTTVDELDTPTGVQTSLREAIRDHAAAAIPADVITFAPGVNGGAIILDAAEGEMVLNRNVAIDATSLPGGLTVAGNNPNSRVFRVGAVTVGLSGFTVIGGHGDQGGALLNDGNLSLTRMVFTGNTATANGGAIFNNAGGGRSITATDCRFTDNTVAGGGAGGAIFNHTGATLTLNTCTVSDNSTAAAAGGSGGGLRNLGGTVVLNRCTFSGNTARTHGGGISNIVAEAGTAASVTLVGCTLAGNTTTGAGGGIHNEFQLGNAATVALTNCTLSGNSADFGGAIYNRSTLMLTQCTLSGNSALFEGGAIINWVGTLTLTNSIVAGSLYPSPEDIRNGNLGATITRVGANIVQSLTNHGLVDGTGTISNAAPLLAPLGNYGGPTQTMPPPPGSPAIDGVPAGAEVASLTTDQRGFGYARPLDGDVNGSALVDLGAVEVRRVLVTTAADELDTPTGAETSLREAIRDNNAAATPADVITFVPSLNGGTIVLDPAKGEFVLDKGMSIDASGLSSGMTIDGGAGTNRIFSVNSDQSVTLKGLTLTGGNGTGAAPTGYGGAIANFGLLTLMQCTLYGNSASQGGALHNRRTLTLMQCTLYGNSSVDFGGAIFNSNVSSLVLTQCTLSGNSADSGGAIYSEGGTLTVTHCTVANNLTWTGGIFVSFGAIVTLANTIIANNRNGGSGVDFFHLSGPLTAGGCLIQNPTNSDITHGVNGNLTGLHPVLGPLGHYGGPTQTMALRRGSPARNAAFELFPTLTSDQRGLPIVGHPDIGAYEAGTTHTFELWSMENTGFASTFTADLENDGHTNGLEYATGTDPLVANPSPFSHPERVTLPPGDLPAYRFSFPYRPDATDLRYLVYRSPDLANWTEIYRNDLPTGVISVFGAVTGDENRTTELITLTDRDFLTPKCFWKLVVEKP